MIAINARRRSGGYSGSIGPFRRQTFRIEPCRASPPLTVRCRSWLRALDPLREFADGVLELTLPKNGVTSLQRIAIQ